MKRFTPALSKLLPLLTVLLCLPMAGTTTATSATTVAASSALESKTGPDFLHDVAPILSRFGCNGSACHGKAEGQNGFKLSVFGNDPAADYEAIVLNGRGRRIMSAAPDQSLFLQKSLATLPHAGGPRMRAGSREYAILREWIAAGAPYEKAARPALVSLRMEPSEALMRFEQEQPLRVVAAFEDGTEEDVTWLSIFHSNNTSLAEVNEQGVVRAGSMVGQAAVMARYAGQIAIYQATLPRPGAAVAFDDGPSASPLDTLINRNLRRLNLAPSSIVDDAGFLRRLYIDTVGRLPSVEEARRFLQDARSDKRARLVDELLERPEWADLWALKWSDLLRVDRRTLGHANAHAYYKWIHSAMRANMPLDEFARQILEAEGPLQENPAGFFFKVTKKSGEMAATASQTLLGIRITCAECHQHPFDRWTQGDYHGMRAFFEQVKYKKTGEDEALVSEGTPAVLHPRTKQPIHAHPLGTPMPDADPPGDRRQALSQWLTAPENPWFARNLANRIWAHYMGRGVVEPVDDVRATNPPSNPALLELLTRTIVEARFDPKALMRVIANSDAYQRTPTPNDTNERDDQNFSRALFRRLTSEVLLDAVCDVAGVSEKFAGVPRGQRAVQLWDSEQQSYFLKLFGRPMRTTPCECERSASASVSQALHFMNAPGLQAKLAHADGHIARWLAAEKDDARFVETLYLAVFSRLPTEQERALGARYLGERGAHRQEAGEDLAWSLLNTIEFVFNH